MTTKDSEQVQVGTYVEGSRYVSPEILLAMTGEEVVFDMTLLEQPAIVPEEE